MPAQNASTMACIGGESERVFFASAAQIAQQRVLAVFGLGISGGVSGSGGRAGEDVRSTEIVAKDFDGFGAESAEACKQRTRSQEENAHRLSGDSPQRLSSSMAIFSARRNF